MSDSGYIRYHKDGRKATIEFYHPAHNSLPGNLLNSLQHTIEEAGKDDEVGIIILKSAGNRTFCAGASFQELSSIVDIKSGKEFFMGFARVVNAMRKCPKLIIGRVQGKAVGGGVGIISACDYSVAAKFASVRLSELKLGIGPFVIGPSVERKVGITAFSEWSLTPDIWQGAKIALDKGLYNNVFDTLDHMDQHLHDFTDSLLEYNADAIIQLKKVFWHDTDHWDTLLEDRAAISGRLILSPHSKKIIQSMLQSK